jgi:hypothetical protein
MLEEISCGTSECENPLKISDFPGFLTRAWPGMKFQAVLWIEMVVAVVVYDFDFRVIPCQLDKLMSPWVENFKIDIFRGFYI